MRWKVAIMRAEGHPLPVWVITENPSDMPGKTVARRQDVYPDRIEISVTDFIVASLEELRERFRSMGLVCLGRDPADDPVIVESWI